jgi:multiple antibiotic resistance protein
VAAVAILVAALFFGVWLLKAFGITIDSFRVAGGLVILLEALAMSVHAPDRSLPGGPPIPPPNHDDAVAIVPLAVPFLAGPGSISLVLVFTHADPTPLHDLICVGILVLLGAMTWLTFRIAPAVARLVGPRGMKTATRLMSLVIAAMGVELMAQGLLGLFPGLK